MNSADRLSFKNLYLKRLLRALRSLNGRTAGGSSLGKRRRAIKLAADISLALTARRAVWSHHALMNNLFSKKNKSLVEKIAGRRKLHSILALARNRPSVLRRSAEVDRSSMQKLGATGFKRCFKRRIKYSGKLDDPLPSLRMKMLKKRAKELRRLIPGGEWIRSSCLLREMVDYMVSLKTQVEVMQSLANSLQLRHSV